MIRCGHHTRQDGRYVRCPNEATVVIPSLANKPARCDEHGMVEGRASRPLMDRERSQGFVEREVVR